MHSTSVLIENGYSLKNIIQQTLPFWPTIYLDE